MPRRTVRDRVAALPARQKQAISQMARGGRSIVEIARRYKLDYSVVQALLWEQETLPWQGSKAIITRRLRSLRTATRRESRDKLVEDVKEQVDYLYYAATQLRARLDKVKKSIR